MSCFRPSRNWTKWELPMWKGCLTLDERQDGLELEALALQKSCTGVLQGGRGGNRPDIKFSERD